MRFPQEDPLELDFGHFPVDKVHAYKMLNDKSIETSEHNNSFPICQNLNILPSFALCDVDIIVSGDNDDATDNSRTFHRKPGLSLIPQLRIFIICSIYVSVYPCLFQLDYSMGRLVSMLQINFSLPTKNTKSIIRNRIRDNNLFFSLQKAFIPISCPNIITQLS